MSKTANPDGSTIKVFLFVKLYLSSANEVQEIMKIRKRWGFLCYFLSYLLNETFMLIQVISNDFYFMFYSSVIVYNPAKFRKILCSSFSFAFLYAHKDAQWQVADTTLVSALCSGSWNYLHVREPFYWMKKKRLQVSKSKWFHFPSTWNTHTKYSKKDLDNMLVKTNRPFACLGLI